MEEEIKEITRNDFGILPIDFDTDKFRQEAIRFQKTGTYCSHEKGTRRYREYWDKQIEYCLDGIEIDGVSITGYHYFYLNFCRIKQVIKKPVQVRGKWVEKKMKVYDFPRFYDYDKFYFDSVEKAALNGDHFVVLKARRKGYSFKCAAMLCRNFYLIRNSVNYVVAGDKQFLIGDGILTKVTDYLNFIDQHTAWGKRRQVSDTIMHRKASYIENVDGKSIEKGYKSEIIGVTIKNDAQKLRGISCNLILFEEAGKNPELLEAFAVVESSMSQGVDTYGQAVLFGTGGCVCAGTKVWDNNGSLYNIEELPQRNGILGFQEGGISKEDITYWQKPTLKECLRIITNSGKQLECSIDHPILKGIKIKNFTNIVRKDFVAANDLSIRDNIAVIDSVPLWGEKKMWEPRVIGWLIGDGTYGYNQSPRLSNCDYEITDYIYDNFEVYFNHGHTTKKNDEYVELGIKGICPKLRELGIYGQTKLKKTLPKEIHSYLKEDISNLLGGIFDTDGYVSIRKNKQRDTFLFEVSLSSASRTLLIEISLLLQKFGIHGILRERQPRKNNPRDKNSWFEFTISDSVSLIRFHDNIKFSIKRKQEKLNKIYTEALKRKPHRQYNGWRYEQIISIENIGIKQVYNLTANTTNTYLANGFITHNTEGADFEGIRELFYNPKAYGIYAMENIWDVAQTEPCGFFVPDFAHLEGYITPNGISMIQDARDFRIQERKKKEQADPGSIDRYVSEHPFTPAEAVLQSSGNIFPQKLLMEQLNWVEADDRRKKKYQTGTLRFDESGTVKFDYNGSLKPILDFPLRDDRSTEGCVTIWEHPYFDDQGLIPKGLYIAGIDPYDHDQSGTNSLGSVFVFKRFYTPEHEYNIIVAEYTGRPQTADEFYEITRMLLIYFNAVALYENNIKGLHKYFVQKKSEYLLADTPETKDIIKDSKVQRGKGIHMTKEIISWSEKEIKKYLLEYDGKRYGWQKIYSIPLLKELISYNIVGNFDRCLDKDTMITTIDGYKKISDMCIGDMVLTHNNRFMPITGLSINPNHNNEILKIKIKSVSEDLLITENHPILSIRIKRQGVRKRIVNKRLEDIKDGEWIKASELQKNDLVLMPKRKGLNRNTLDDDLLYLMGWYLSDGNISNSQNTVNLYLHISQDNIADKLIEIINRYTSDEFMVNPKSTNESNRFCKKRCNLFRKIYLPHGKQMIHIRGTSKFLHSLFLTYCGGPRKKLINHNLYNSSNLLPLVVGFLEGDGHQKIDKLGRNIIECSSIYIDLLKQIRQILIDNGIYNSICIKRARNEHRKPQATISISGKNVLPIVNLSNKFHYSEISTYDKTFGYETDNGYWVPIDKIEKINYTDNVYNFSVAEDESYTASGIVVHNCRSLGCLMIYQNSLYAYKVKKQQRAETFFPKNPFVKTIDNFV